MNPAIIELSEKIKSLEGDLEVQLALARADLRLSFEGGKVEFEQEVLRRHREMKTSLMHYVMGARLLILLTAPVIYILIIPLALLDIFITIYQAICFPVYGISKVRRADYLIFDRRYLAYFNALEKLNCAYCSYANGLIGYVREIASRTEAYWCPIKHARKVVGAHPRYSQFADFGDAKEYKREINEINERLRKKKSEAT
jgi:hypothetical protein